MRCLFVRPSPALRRRTAFAAAQRGVSTVQYTKRVLEVWLLAERRPSLPPVEEESGPYQSARYPVSDAAHRQARVLSAEADISISTLAIRILEAYTPHEVEVLAEVISGPPPRGRVSLSRERTP